MVLQCKNVSKRQKGMVNIEDPDRSLGAVWSWSALFA